MAEERLPRLLVLDDETGIRTTLATYFTAVGYSVETAASVPEALQKLTREFDVVLSDVRMPGADGIDFLQTARLANPQLGVFLMTGYPTMDTVIDAKQHGAAAYFRKPLRLSEVASRLQGFLGTPEKAND